jgi:hypothetical protein
VTVLRFMILILSGSAAELNCHTQSTHLLAIGMHFRNSASSQKSGEENRPFSCLDHPAGPCNTSQCQFGLRHLQLQHINVMAELFQLLSRPRVCQCRQAALKGKSGTETGNAIANATVVHVRSSMWT